MSDPQTAAREMIERVLHPKLGEIPVIGRRPILTDAPGVRSPAPSGRAHRRGARRVWLLRRGDRPRSERKKWSVGHGAATRRADSRSSSWPAAAASPRPRPGPLSLDDARHRPLHADLAAIPPTFRDTATLLHAPRRADPPPAAKRARALKVTPGAPITVEARLNGVALTLIVDTGADRNRDLARVDRARGTRGRGGRSIQSRGHGTSNRDTRDRFAPRVAGARIGRSCRRPRAAVDVSRAGGSRRTFGRDVLDAFTLSVDTASGRATLTPR